jgi:predicted permease
MGTLGQDIRFALRLLAKTPGISVLAMLALALGIGANTAIFSLVNAALLRPLPGIEEAEQLVQFERLQRDRVSSNFGYPDYLDYRNRNQTLSGLAAHVGTPMSFTAGASGQDPPERVRGELVTGDYFSVLGVKPALGRLIDSDDDGAPGAHPVAVLGYGFWQRAFASTDVIGHSVSLNGHSFTIVGVAGGEFGGTATGTSIDIWLPMPMLAEGMPRTRSDGSSWFGERAWGWLGILGRLKPGVTLEQAQAEMKTIARQLEQSYPITNEGRSVRLISDIGLGSGDRDELGKFLGLLLAAVVLLLLISCGNAANLLLVRAAARRREIAVRLALGATRGRLIRQLLTEGVLLSLPAGALGLLLAPWAGSAIVALQQPSTVLSRVETSLDFRVLAFTLTLSVATGILFGLLPALQASKTNLVTSLKDGAAASSKRGSRMQSLLVVSQIALSLMLLIGAGLVVKTMRTVLTADPGFDRANLLLMSVDLTIQEYTEQRGKSFYDQITRRLETVPGVVSASLAKTVPPNAWSDRLSIFYPGEEPPQEVLRGRDDLGLRVELNRIAPDYFRTLGITVLKGREFNPADGEGAPAAAVINEKLANRLWPEENAIGKRLSAPALSGPPRPPLEVVGVVKDTRHRSLLLEPPLILYVPEQQDYDGRATIVVRTMGDPKSLIPAIRSEVAALDKSLQLTGVKTMSEQISSTLWQQQMAAGLIGLFGLLALLLAAIGLYGVIAQFVAQRNREIAIRMALGAGTTEVVKLVLKQGSTLAIAGVAVGLVTALISTRVLSSLLWGVSATDAATFIAASAVLIAVPMLASIIPARRASRIDPVVALRQE